ncbi:MAG: hypothetical protein LCH59_05875 [Proteobacteria bacterium]|jgi:hypothetical protein|nr:hypothetical protein [Pseudomonadota bacterium]
MRALSTTETMSIVGGNGNSAARNAAIKQCVGLPDETKVTFEIKIESNASGKVAGVGGESTTTQTVKVETTCGDLRKGGGG